MEIITENKIKVWAEIPKKDVHAKMKVFYNPVMKSNRDISILLLNSVPNKNMKIALPLAGTGIRGLRLFKELKKNKNKMIYLNDLKSNFTENFFKNLKLNKLKADKFIVHNEDASLFLLNQDGFDYIDIDPFGSPNPFLAAAIARISRKGILAVTATDTAALTGTYQKVTKRKYWAGSLKNYLMHELGLRILIRKVQLQAAQFDKALIPILSYHKDHYFRVYFKAEKGKERCDEIIKQHQYFLFNPQTLEFKTSVYNKDEEYSEKGKEYSEKEGYQFAGPLWVGKLFDQKLLEKMVRNNPFPEEQKFLQLLKEESKIDVPGFYDLHALAHIYRSNPPQMEISLKRLNGARTHFSPNGIKTEKGIKEIVTAIYSSSCYS